MTDQLLGILKIALLALLYLFFARVLWAVWSEVRGPRHGNRPAVPTGHASSVLADPTANAAGSPGADPARRARRGAPSKLVVLLPKERKGAAFPMNDEITIGRAPTCTISITDDTFVSTLHARLFRDPDGVVVEDLASTNGSFLNGVRLNTAQRFELGDRLQIGSTVMEGQ